MRLQDKVAIITGAAQGIGKGTAKLMAQEGAKVVVADIDATKGEETVAEIKAAGGEAAFVRTDVEQEAEVVRMIDFAVDRHGKLDVLMNNAYWNKDGTVVDLEIDDWNKSVNVMVRAIYLGSKYAIPHMIRNGRGSIINTASVHGYLAAANSAVYEASKAAVINLSRQIAVDFGPKGIRCNAICPGWIITEKGEAGLAGHPEWLEKGSQVYPVRRAGRPIDIAYGAVYLASDESTFVSGHALVIDGGMTAWLQDSLAHHVEQYLKEHDAK
ncbi:MAG TPA: SDR family oxidoreductase [Chloroflexota bacterium]|nr:SDR family oxidoreductase [Chloroflexota bacterium]